MSDTLHPSWTTNRCPRCDRSLPNDAPGGLCPTCVMQAALRPDPRASTAALDGAEAEVEPLPEGFAGLAVLERIGGGGMGSVYKARQSSLDRLVALKVMHPKLAERAEFAERFLREARALARLDHPNVVRVHSCGKAQDRLYLVMEYVDGVNLRTLLRGGPLDPARAMALIPRLCEALQYAHEHGVVHRDIKPENILIDREGRVKIADFGLAKLVGPASDSFLTGRKDVMGTPRYMAPEQLKAPLSVDHRADLYALGVVIYELLTGELPIGHFAPPSEKAPVDVRLDQIVLKALAERPEARWQSARELQSSFADLARRPAPVRPAYDQAERPPKSRGAGWCAVLGCLALCVMGSLPVLGFLFLATSQGVPDDMPMPPDRADPVESPMPWNTPGDALPVSRYGPDQRAHLAVGDGVLPALQLALAEGADPSSRDGQGRSLLIKAAAGGEAGMVDALLAAGAALHDKDDDGSTALHAAVRGGHQTVAARLLAAGALPDEADARGWTALHCAAATGATRLLPQLAEADFGAVTRDGDTALQLAVKAGERAMVEALLEKPGREAFDRPDDEGRSPFWNACERGHVAIAELLKAAGLTVRKPDDEGVSPWLAAMRAGHAGVLLAFPDDVDDLAGRDGDGRNLLHWAAWHGDLRALGLALLEDGAVTTAVDHHGNNVWMLAAQRGHAAFLEALERSPAPVGRCDEALALAVAGGHWECAAVLRDGPLAEVPLEQLHPAYRLAVGTRHALTREHDDALVSVIGLGEPGVWRAVHMESATFVVDGWKCTWERPWLYALALETELLLRAGNSGDETLAEVLRRLRGFLPEAETVLGWRVWEGAERQHQTCTLLRASVEAALQDRGGPLVVDWTDGRSTSEGTVLGPE